MFAENQNELLRSLPSLSLPNGRRKESENLYCLRNCPCNLQQRGGLRMIKLLNIVLAVAIIAIIIDAIKNGGGK